MSENIKNGHLLEEEVCPLRNPQDDHDRKIERYTKAKTRSLALSNFILNQGGELYKYGHKIKDCGSYLIFRYYYNQQQYRLKDTSFCKKHLLCSLCAIRRAAKQLQAYLDKAKIVLFENQDCELAFVTITVKNGEDILERFNHLQSNHRKIIERRRNVLKGKTTDTVFKLFEGGVSTYEFTNKGKGWHPHMHMIALVKKGFNHSKQTKNLKREWEELTGDSHQCDIRPIDAHDEKSLLKSFIEVFKYTVKFNDMSLADQAEAGLKLHKKRLIATFGKFYGVKVSSDLNDTIEEKLKLQPYIDMIYRYSDSFGYQLHDSYNSQFKPVSIKEELTDLRLEYEDETIKDKPSELIESLKRKFLDKKKLFSLLETE